MILLLAIPLIAGRVPPNFWYGVRTPKTMSSRKVWYAANRRGGIYLLIASVVTLLATFALRDTSWSPQHSARALLVVVLAPILVALVGSMVHLRRL